MKITGKHELLLQSLIQFYDESQSLKVVTPIIKEQTDISLRLLDWLVTNYAKKRSISYLLHENKNFNIWLDYKRQLKAYSKKQFDPFCRRQRVFYNTEAGEATFVTADSPTIDHSKGFVTTVGQLNFFKWAISNKIIEYAFDNLAIIEEDMLQSVDQGKNHDIHGKKTRRKELSRSANKSVNKEKISIVINFG